MLSRFLRSTLLLLVVFSIGAHATTVDLHRVKYIKHQDHTQTVSSVSAQKPGNNIIDQLLNQSGAAHISTQTYKPVQFIKAAVLFTQQNNTCLSSLKYTSGRSAASFSLFREQILYPFHGFW